jgi:hypothetical protein
MNEKLDAPFTDMKIEHALRRAQMVSRPVSIFGIGISLNMMYGSQFEIFLKEVICQMW